MDSRRLAEKYFDRGRKFLGCRYPFLCGAMTWVSDPRLVASVCNEGGFGCLAGGNAPPEALRAQIEETRRRTDKPFAINLVTIAPAFRDQLELVREMAPDFIVFAGSFPNARAVERAKSCGARVLTFASTESIAARMLRYGVDALILEGMEAGGHVGHVSLMILLQQVLFKFTQVPIFVAGGIADGRMCAHLFLMGAAGVQLGTRFALARESGCHPNMKAAFVKAQARDAVATPQFDSRLPVVAVRALKNAGQQRFSRLQLDLLGKLDRGEITRAEAQEQVERYWMGALRKAVVEGDVAEGSLMAGQSVGLLHREESIREIITDLVASTEMELERIRDGLA